MHAVQLSWRSTATQEHPGAIVPDFLQNCTVNIMHAVQLQEFHTTVLPRYQQKNSTRLSFLGALHDCLHVSTRLSF